MPHYMIQASYTPEAWAGLVKKPQDRSRALRDQMKSVRGRLVSFYNAFGESDVVVIAEMPNDQAAAAFSIAAAAGGAVTNLKTTKLLTAAEGLAVLRAAKKAKYTPPS